MSAPTLSSVGTFVARRSRSLAGAIVIGAVSTAGIVACSPAANDAQPAREAPAAAPVAAPEAVAGEAPAVRLDELTEADLADADLAGELACSFSLEGGPLILVARGVVGVDDPAQGVVKVAGQVEPIRAPGGYNGMLRDPTFTGQGRTVRIEETGAAIGGGESPPRPATLTYQRADGATRSFDGRWQCGP